MAKTVIIGGGITGLAAALFSKLKDPKGHVVLFEASDRLGGWIRSKRFVDGSVHELGPRTIRMQSPTINKIIQVIDNINITNKIIPISKTNTTFQKRFIFAHDKLHLLDFSLLKPAQTPFTESILKKVVKASLKKYQHESNFQDLPVDYFVRTRFGDEIADYVVDPVIRGIYACDSRDLSMQATFGGLLEMEKLGSNVVIGAMRNYLQNIFKSNESCTADVKSLELKEHMKDASVISFKGGLETLIDSMTKRVLDLGVEIHTGAVAVKVKGGDSSQYSVQMPDRSESFDRLLCAVPGHVAAPLLAAVCASADMLSHIQWNTVAVVVLEYRGRLIPRTGFGHLIPSWEQRDVLGVIYDSCILPENDPINGGTTRYTVMLGGAWFEPSIAVMNSDELIAKAVSVMRHQLAIKGDLIRSTAVVNHNCIPVYGLKHRDLVLSVRKALLDRKLPIRLCGNTYDGVSLSDCVHSAHTAVQSLYT